MTNLIFASIIGALLIFNYLQQRSFSKQINELTKAVVAKHTKDYLDITRAEQSKKPEKEVLNEEIALSDLPDDKFLEAIDKYAQQ